MKRLSCLALFSSYLISSIAYSALFTPQFNVYGGANRAYLGPGKLVIASVETDALQGKKSNNEFTSGLGISFTKIYTPLIDASIGADLMFANTENNGAVNQFAIPTLNAYHYYLYAKSTRLMLDGTIGFHVLKEFAVPFLKASVGPAAITSKYYETSNSPFVTSGQLSFPSRTKYNLAYSIGGGFKKKIANNLQLSFLYLYTDLGTIETGISSNAPGRFTIIDPIKANFYTSSA